MGSSLERYSKYSIEDKTRSRKRVEELKNNFPWKEKNTAFGRVEEYDCDSCQDDIDGTGILDQGKSSVTQYNLLENQTSVRVLLRLMETNKDFGVKDDE